MYEFIFLSGLCRWVGIRWEWLINFSRPKGLESKERKNVWVQLQKRDQRCCTLPPVALIVIPHHVSLSDIVRRQMRVWNSVSCFPHTYQPVLVWFRFQWPDVISCRTILIIFTLPSFGFVFSDLTWYRAAQYWSFLGYAWFGFVFSDLMWYRAAQYWSFSG